MLLIDVAELVEFIVVHRQGRGEKDGRSVTSRFSRRPLDRSERETFVNVRRANLNDEDRSMDVLRIVADLRESNRCDLRCD